jgi:hypothetical protein
MANPNPGIPQEVWDTLNRHWNQLHEEGKWFDTQVKFIFDPHLNTHLCAVVIEEKVDKEYTLRAFDQEPGAGALALGFANASIDELIDVTRSQFDQQLDKLAGTANIAIMTFRYIDDKSGMATGAILRDDGVPVFSLFPNHMIYYALRSLAGWLTAILGEQVIEVRISKRWEGALNFDLVFA